MRLIISRPGIGWNSNVSMKWCSVTGGPPEHVHGAPIERAPLEPRIAGIAPLGRYRPCVELRVQHLHDGFDLNHLGAELVAGLAVALDLADQLGMKLKSGCAGLALKVSRLSACCPPMLGTYAGPFKNLVAFAP